MSCSPFRRVLVGWDASASAAEALSVAASVAGDGGHVVALAVLPGAPATEVAEEHRDDLAAFKRRAEERFTQARRDASSRNVRISLHVVEDRQVGRAVCKYADEHGFDLLVLGRHGEGGALHPRLGRVAEAAARASTLPVLLVSVR